MYIVSKIKHKNSFSIIILCAVFISLFASCGSGDDGSNTGDGSIASNNFIGEWIIDRVPDPVTLDSSFDCNIHNEVTAIYTISVNGDSATISTYGIPAFQGTVSGSQFNFNGTFEDDGGQVYVDGQLNLTSPTELTGSGVHRYEEGEQYCEWVEDFYGKKVQYSEECITVTPGEWEFNWEYRGTVIMTFTGGELNQSGCYLSYDDDNFFTGEVIDDEWSGENVLQGFRFSGRFAGNPATNFRGTATGIEGIGTLTMTGEYVGTPQN